MAQANLRRFAVPAVSVVGICLVASFIWQVPYIVTLICLSAWAFVGHLITIDDDMPGGWSNPDGVKPFPRKELAIKFLLLLSLCLLAQFVPVIREFGGN